MSRMKDLHQAMYEAIEASLQLLSQLPDDVAAEASARIMAVVAVATGIPEAMFLSGLQTAYRDCVQAQPLARTTGTRVKAEA